MKNIFIIAFCLATILGRGQITSSSTPLPSFKYGSSMDLDLLNKVLTNKERSFNNNYAEIQTRYKWCRKMLNYIQQPNKEFLSKELNKLVKLINENGIVNPYIVNDYFNYFDFIEYWIDYVLKNPNEILKYS